jgi:hypothetical protein
MTTKSKKPVASIRKRAAEAKAKPAVKVSKPVKPVKDAGDLTIPAFLDRKKNPHLAAAAGKPKGKPVAPPKGKPPTKAPAKPAPAPKPAPEPQRPLTAKDKLLAKLRGSTAQPTHGKAAKGQGNVVPLPTKGRVAPGTQLTLQTIRIGMPVVIRDKNGHPGTKVYTILAWPPNEPAYSPDFFVYSEDYAAHISDIVAA